MTTASVEVPHRDIPRFEEWLASQCEDGISPNDLKEGANLAGLVSEKATKFAAIKDLMEQVNGARAGEIATVSGDAEVLLWQCQAITLDYAEPITNLDSPGDWDFDAAAEAVDSLAHWVGEGKKVQAVMGT